MICHLGQTDITKTCDINERLQARQLIKRWKIIFMTSDRPSSAASKHSKSSDIGIGSSSLNLIAHFFWTVLKEILWDRVGLMSWRGSFKLHIVLYVSLEWIRLPQNVSVSLTVFSVLNSVFYYRLVRERWRKSCRFVATTMALMQKKLFAKQ